MTAGAVVVERVPTPRGELVLRRDGEHYEVISNGTFLMDTRAGASERLLVSAAVATHPRPRRLLIGGLGVGFSLAEAVADPRLEQIVVVEIEPELVGWHRTHLAAYSAAGLDDARTELVTADLREHLTCSADSYDVICLDVDNGPHWTVTESNAALYDATGIDVIASRLAAGGVLAVWSAEAAPAYEALLRRRFGRVAIHEVPVPRGEPDVVYVAAEAGRLAATGPRGVRR